MQTPDVPDQSHYFGGGGSETLLHPIVAVALLIAIVLVFALPRKKIIIPISVIAFLVPLGQSVYAVGMHWLVLRIIILAGLARLLIIKFTTKKPLLVGGFNNVDKVVLICVSAQVICTPLRYMNVQALVNQLGVLIEWIGGYILVRALIQDEDDIYRTIKCLAVLAIILGLGMIREQRSLQNIFGALGGTRAVPEIREGKVRSQGAFQHSLTAGTFGATLLPLFFLLWKNGKAKAIAVVGILGSTAMTICANSSTPLLAYVAGILGVGLWPIRKKMKSLRWGIVIFLLGLQLVMKAPFWFVIAHIDLTGSSSGYHRAELVDQFIRHFTSWWLIGTNDAGTWAYDLWDQQNQFVSVGENGGLLALICFIAMISRSYGKIGRARKAVEGQMKEWFLWFLGVALFANVVASFGVNYFDQVKVIWLIVLAMISAAAFSGREMQKTRLASTRLDITESPLSNGHPFPESVLQTLST